MNRRRQPAGRGRRGPETGAGAFASAAPAPCRATAAAAVAALGLLVLALCLIPVPSPAAQAGRAAPPAPPVPPRAGAATAGRDSLMQEIRRYRQAIRVLSDSLAQDRAAGLSPEHRVVIERNIGDITRVIEGIGTELKQLEFEVKDNRISLVDGAGDGIVINVPENLDERVSQGLEALTQAILEEIPDSTGRGSRRLTWSSFLPAHEPPEPPRRIIDGNLVRVGQSLVVAADEDVRGNVVVVFGDCEVAGRVEGNVVVVGGALGLRDAADVSGSVVSVGGRLTADPGARTGDTVALDMLGGGAGKGLGRLLDHRVLSFAIAQGLFILTLVAALLAVTLAPASRLDVVLARLESDPARVFGAGALLVLFGPAVVAMLAGLLVITVIGLPVALLLLLGVALVVVLGLSAAGLAVGRRLGAGGRGHALATLLGLCLLHVPSFAASLLNLAGAPLAVVGVLLALGLVVKAAALAGGLGALTMTRLGGRGRSA